MSSAISPVSYSHPASTSPSTTSPPAASPTSGLANESTFLSLLVTQLKNQDPLSPADSTQFVTQLAQFSQLEDLQNINQNVITISGDISSAVAAAGAGTNPAPPTTTP